MRRAVPLLVLCFIAFSEVGCSRRTARVELPSVAAFSRDQRNTRNRGPANEMRDAIESLKNKVQASPEAGDTSASDRAGVVAQSGQTSTPAPGVGTSGSMSVETRYAGSHNSAPHASSRGHLLSRTGNALQHAARGASLWVIGLCALAAGLIVALLWLRPHSSA